ncbi:ATP-binding protein [Streptomyces sp. NPDC090025]|uniref:ATP-binding protein n=1 Tax=Streptomyces sp. NPDC090025 TaxID=3365922 RepID=UPI003838284B
MTDKAIRSPEGSRPDGRPGGSRVPAAAADAPALRKRPRLTAPYPEVFYLVRRREAVREARRAVRGLLSRWRFGPEGLFRVELIVSELLTNAFRYARPSAGRGIGLQVTRGLEGVLIEVEDAGSAKASMFDARSVGLSADEDSEHGRGLLLVAQLSEGWGWRRLGNGHNSVWALVGGEEAEVGAGLAEGRTGGTSYDPVRERRTNP